MIFDGNEAASTRRVLMELAIETLLPMSIVKAAKAIVPAALTRV